MKIKIADYSGSPTVVGDQVTVDVRARHVELVDVFNGVGIDTDQGHFGIAQRDQGIEVVLDGVLVWSSMGVVVKG